MSENLILAVNESIQRKNKWGEILESINLKEYINNDENFIKQFKEFYFELKNSNPRGAYNNFLEKFSGKKIELDYNLYNDKYFNYKRNIEKQIFEKFISFLNIKISNQIYLKSLKQANLKVEVWNICPVHKEKAPSVENINKEIFCTCQIV